VSARPTCIQQILAPALVAAESNSEGLGDALPVGHALTVAIDSDSDIEAPGPNAGWPKRASQSGFLRAPGRHAIGGEFNRSVQRRVECASRVIPTSPHPASVGLPTSAWGLG
jgi:hypothetical protein